MAARSFDTNGNISLVVIDYRDRKKGNHRQSAGCSSAHSAVTRSRPTNNWRVKSKGEYEGKTRISWKSILIASTHLYTCARYKDLRFCISRCRKHLGMKRTISRE
ncbi:uncharacterized protein LOC122527378 isoform X2 [Frieseomelitta varia]|uniref:uncharacterized protein LOC122527378 isoform X2 n=1 Tax=Frieseomelitta varia TaxID=561572 RepID=UPI001CB6B648|nr:uncharacterized protein LOC122527378 isoform X2 [Frieseomelitta varia]